MPSIDWTVDENIAVVTMNHGENRFNIRFITEILTALDDIERKTEANALVVTSGDAKIWSNGMDLEWLAPAISRKDPDVEKFIDLQDMLLKRMLFYPMVTVAALNGHVFAIGAMFACCFDFRFMRSDRGYLCFPAIDLDVPIPPHMMALVKKMLPNTYIEEAVLSAKRFTATDLEKCSAVRKACTTEGLMKEATGFAKSLNKGRGIVSDMKKVLYKDIDDLIARAAENRPNLRHDIPIR